jgi:hypothetical protein
MGTIPISAPVDRAVVVQVFEPRQTPEQDEVEIDRFTLGAGETRDYEVRSATAAYRTFPGEVDLDAVRKAAEPKVDQEPIYGDINPGINDEIKAGKDRRQEHEERERKLQRAEKAQDGKERAPAVRHRQEVESQPAANLRGGAARLKEGEGPMPEPTGPTSPDPLKDQRNAPAPKSEAKPKGK